ncbi:MAG: DegT/DnrJ/EryC1/StrS family aminotransferase [Kiritimatiellae bacterium]|nr:DegT/DnrJ/EryC1/StrS family aminotransferase [Kiritimatiellia bacterium]
MTAAIEEEKDAKFTGSETEGGITSSYAIEDGVKLKVAYSFFGSIYDEDERAMIEKALGQDTLTMGPLTTEFQDAFAKKHGVKHAFACSNCTTGMHLAMQVMGVREGDEVIVTPNTFIATSLVVLKQKAIPVYADIDPRTFNIDPKQIAKKITPKTKAISVVHYGGQMCDMDPIMDLARKHGLLVLEDCAHAHNAAYKGRKAGSVGDIGAFSFHSLKNMTTCGEGGMLTTNRDEWTKKIEMLRCMNLTHWDPARKAWAWGGMSIEKTDPVQYWIPSHFDIDDVDGEWGNNYRMNEVQAGVGLAQLRKLDRLSEKRREIGRKITEGISGIKGITPVYEDPNGEHVYHLYTLCVEEEELGAGRDEFLLTLYRDFGVQGILHYQPTYHFTGLRKLGRYADNECPIAEKFFYKRELNLPMHPRLTDADIETMCAGIRGAAEKVRR